MISKENLKSGRIAKQGIAGDSSIVIFKRAKRLGDSVREIQFAKIWRVFGRNLKGPDSGVLSLKAIFQKSPKFHKFVKHTGRHAKHMFLSIWVFEHAKHFKNCSDKHFRAFSLFVGLSMIAERFDTIWVLRRDSLRRFITSKKLSGSQNRKQHPPTHGNPPPPEPQRGRGWREGEYL